LLGAAVIAVAGTTVVLNRGDQPPPPLPDIPLDAWAPYWTLEDSVPELAQRVRSMRDVSPFWYEAVSATEIRADANANAELSAQFLEIARRSGADVVPSVVDAMPAGGMAAVLADPVVREQHVRALVDFVREGDFDGIDLDYEQFAFADGRETWPATRPNWVTFITELGDALHTGGKTLTVSIPPVYDAEQTAESGYWVYDYGAIAAHVDRIRIMAYDFSVAEPGPIAPLAWVEESIDGAIEATGDPSKLVLGLPSYGRNWPTFVSGTCPPTDVPGVTTVTARSVDDLIARRNATPVFVESTGETTFEYDLELTDGISTCVQTRQVNYVDANGIRARMDLAREKQLSGVSLWALGFDDEAVWDAILPTVTDPGATTVADN
jgi:spore germination protein YaaH